MALTLVVGGAFGFWFATSAVAQASTLAPNNPQFSCHDNQSVFQLLGTSREELLAQRQAGKSLLEIAQAKGVGEDKLTNALLQPMNGMHDNSQANVGEMTQGMRDQFARDLRESKFGTITDFHLSLDGNGDASMMNGATTNGMTLAPHAHLPRTQVPGSAGVGKGTGRGMMDWQRMMGR